jgi:mono/diheme cytochrome c family protein
MEGRRGAAAGAIFLVTMAAILAALLFGTGPLDPFRIADPAAQRIAAGRAVYLQYCAACHGRNLEGQPDWQSPLPSGRLPAPPHDKTGHTWHHPDEMLAGITKKGILPYAPQGYESDMPAFGAVLTDEQIAALWAYVKSTWPERERRYQAQMTRQSELPKQTQ